MDLLSNIFARMMSSPGKTFGKAIAESTRGVNLVDGKETWELAADKKQDLEMMKKCCDAEVATYERIGLVPAPYYFERVAILSRRSGNLRLEISYCENYIAVVDEWYRKNNISENQGPKAGPRYKAIVSRLSKARQLLAGRERATQWVDLSTQSRSG